MGEKWTVATKFVSTSIGLGLHVWNLVWPKIAPPAIPLEQEQVQSSEWISFLH